jgi:hypothetical protein
MAGTYAMLTTTTLTFPAVSQGGIEAIEASPSEGVNTYAWYLRHHTVAADGTLSIDTIPCGGTTPDLCDTVLDVAHAQYQPNQIWGEAKLSAGFPTVTTNIENTVPGGSFAESSSATLMGIVLDDPFGEWPPCRQCVGVDAGVDCVCPGQPPHEVTNQAAWFDADDDTRDGVTTVYVPAGGQFIDGNFPDPPHDYPEPSECPRLDNPSGGWGYEQWPGVVGISLFYTYRWNLASRFISALQSDSVTMNDNQQCEITGTLTGVVTDTRVAGCDRCTSGTCDPSGPCTDSQVDAYDGVEQNQTVTGVSFVMTKSTTIDVAAILAESDEATRESLMNQACAELRANNCPPGKSCD